MVRVGPKQAENVVFVSSGTHGVEGFCGSGAQIDWLRGDRRLPRGTAMLVVHAINPHGFAWARRVTQLDRGLRRTFVAYVADRGVFVVPVADLPSP